jgi:uncharacterized membrane protein
MLHLEYTRLAKSSEVILNKDIEYFAQSRVFFLVQVFEHVWSNYFWSFNFKSRESIWTILCRNVYEMQSKKDVDISLQQNTDYESLKRDLRYTETFFMLSAIVFSSDHSRTSSWIDVECRLQMKYACNSVYICKSWDGHIYWIHEKLDHKEKLESNNNMNKYIEHLRSVTSLEAALLVSVMHNVHIQRQKICWHSFRTNQGIRWDSSVTLVSIMTDIFMIRLIITMIHIHTSAHTNSGCADSINVFVLVSYLLG